MLTEIGCRSRRERLWKLLPPNVQWMLVSDPRHVNYLSGFWVNPLSLSSGERGILYMERDGETILACDNFAYQSAVGEPFVDKTLIETWYGDLPRVPNRDQVLVEALAPLKGRLEASTGLVESEWFPFAAAVRLGLEKPAMPVEAPSLSEILQRLRRVKDPDELQVLKRCMRAGEAGQSRAREFIKRGVTELEVYAEVQSAATDQLGEPALVYGDFRASTAREIHTGGAPRDYALQQGDTMILDFSVVIAGYRSDFTNTLAVGSPTEDQVRALALCKTAMAEGENVLKPGVGGGEVYAAVAAPLSEAGHPLPSHAGHGLGMGHPEAPAFLPENSERLSAGEVVTLEPGIYSEGIGGIRIEHNFLITESGAERLSHHELTLETRR